MSPAASVDQSPVRLRSESQQRCTSDGLARRVRSDERFDQARRSNRLPVAAALGRIEDARRLLAGANSEDRHLALTLAADFGHVEIVRFLLDAGEDPNRYTRWEAIPTRHRCTK